MFALLIAIVYLSFISLGLPDSLLGAAWPVMRIEFDAPLSYAGIVSMIISLGTIVSSLLSDLLTKKTGNGGGHRDQRDDDGGRALLLFGEYEVLDAHRVRDSLRTGRGRRGRFAQQFRRAAF